MESPSRMLPHGCSSSSTFHEMLAAATVEYDHLKSLCFELSQENHSLRRRCAALAAPTADMNVDRGDLGLLQISQPLDVSPGRARHAVASFRVSRNIAVDLLKIKREEVELLGPLPEDARSDCSSTPNTSEISSMPDLIPVNSSPHARGCQLSSSTFGIISGVDADASRHTPPGANTHVADEASSVDDVAPDPVPRGTARELATPKTLTKLRETSDVYQDASRGQTEFLAPDGVRGFVPRVLAVTSLHGLDGEVRASLDSGDRSADWGGIVADDTHYEATNHEGWFTAVHGVTEPRSGPNTPRKPPSALLAQPDVPEFLFVDDVEEQLKSPRDELNSPTQEQSRTTSVISV